MNQALQWSFVAAAGIAVGLGAAALGGKLSAQGVVSTRGGTVTRYPHYERCLANPSTCEVTVSATYDALRKNCIMTITNAAKKDVNLILAHYNQTVYWKLDPTTQTDFEFDRYQGIDLDGNQDDDDETSTIVAPVFDFAASTPQSYGWKSVKQKLKVMRYSIILRHKPSNTLCIMDPIIVNNG